VFFINLGIKDDEFNAEIFRCLLSLCIYMFLMDFFKSRNISNNQILFNGDDGTPGHRPESLK
jgi:hypothetical protein